MARNLFFLLLIGTLVSASQCGDLVCQELEKVVCPQDCVVENAPAPVQQSNDWFFVFISTFFIVIASVGWFLTNFSLKQDSFYPRKTSSEVELEVVKKVRPARKRLK